VGPTAGPRSSAATVSGQGIASAKNVEIRWNSISGPKLAEASLDSTGSFSVPVTLPDSAPGVYMMIVSADGVSAGRVAFEVTNDGQPAAQKLEASRSKLIGADNWQGFAAPSNGSASLAGSNASATPAGRQSMLAGGFLLATGLAGLLTAGIVSAKRRRSASASVVG